MAAACAALASALGFAASSGEAIFSELQFALAAHRVAGLVSAGLVMLTAALAASAHRRQEPWRNSLYRYMLLVSVLSVWTAAYFGAVIVHGADHFSFR